MTISVSMINMKGGVGKTTLAFNLVWYAAYKLNKRVLAVDLDPQANLSQYLLGGQGYLGLLRTSGRSIVDVFEQFAAPNVQHPAPSPIEPDSIVRRINGWDDGSVIDLLPSRLELSWTLKNPTDKSHLLAKFLSSISSQYDLILIDCAPTESMLTTAAYRSSRYVIVPVRAEFLSTIGLPLLARSLAEFKASFGDQDLEIAGVILNDGSVVSPESREAISDVDKLCKQHKWYRFKNRNPHSDSYPRGSREHTPIFLTKWARSGVEKVFEKVAVEFASRVGL